jgi:quercetin dioxygenase-like cupin family protein
MGVRHLNDFGGEPVANADKTFRQVLIGPDAGPNFAMRRFVIKAGGSMPLHTNLVEHEQFVLHGKARVVIGEETFEVRKDDVVYIPAGIPHMYTTLGNEDFEFLCMVPNKPDKTTLVR